VELLATAFGLSLDEIDAILLNGLRYSFLPAERKAALKAEFVAELARLRASVAPGG
jgi:adenosine deaminase